MRIKNGLVVVVILLFIGVAFQPAIAVNPISSNNEDDCDICPKVSSLHLVRLKSLINRVETLDNKLSVISKFHPKLVGKYQELFDRITTLKEMNREYESDLSWDFPIICNVLYYIFGYQFITLMILIIIEGYYDNQIISSILRTWYAMKVMIVLPTMFILMILNCPQFPPNT